MKKSQLIFIIAAALLLTSCGATAAETTTEQGNETTTAAVTTETTSDITISEPQPIGDYVLPLAPMYDTPAEENGLYETHVYFYGKVKEVGTDGGQRYAVISYDDTDWLVAVGDDTCMTEGELDKLSGKEIVVFGEYLGFSEKKKMPGIYADGYITDRFCPSGKTAMQYILDNASAFIDDESSKTEQTTAVTTTSAPETTSPVTTTTTSTTTTAATTTKKATEADIIDSSASGPNLGEANALKKALSYLKFTAFSYTGLIEQLEYEGYTTAEATYAVDNCGASWKEQALDKALSYLDFAAFSYTGLIEQLEYEGFTSSEATYGADNCGADWNEQAAKKAASYLSFMSLSRSGLIEQLEYEGFTHSQAVYGAEQNGY